MEQPLHTDLAWSPGLRVTAFALGLGAFLTQLDVTAVIMAMPAIGREFDIAMPALAWAIDAYSLAFTGALMIAGALTDRFGRRRALLLGNAVFLLASLACGLAWSAPVLWGARAVQGIAAAFIVTGALASIAAVFPGPEQRARAFGLVGVLSGIAMALGPSLGGAVSAWFGWRWIFLANLLPCLLIALVVPRRVGEAQESCCRPIDWPGVILLTAALGLVIKALLSLRDAPILAWSGLLAGFVLLVFFATWQRRATHPALEPAVFASAPMLGIATLLGAVSVGYWAVLVYLPLFLGAAFGWTSDMVGLALLLATLPMLVLPPVAGRIAPRLGWRRLFARALFAMVAGGLALAAATQANGASAILAATLGMVALGVGAALAHPQLSGAVMALAPAQMAGTASAVTVVARQAGFALGIAALGAVAPAASAPAGFIWLFAVAAVASALGLAACWLLPPAERRNL